MGTGVEISLLSCIPPEEEVFPFLKPPSWISGFRLHVIVSAVAPLDSSTSKVGGSYWNFIPICHITQDMSGFSSDLAPRGFASVKKARGSEG
jgi:hypothetical protein